MNGYRLSSHKLLTTVVVVVALAGALAAGLGACQKEQSQTATPPAEQGMKTPAPEKNPGDTSGTTPPTDQSGGAGQKSQ